MKYSSRFPCNFIGRIRLVVTSVARPENLITLTPLRLPREWPLAILFLAWMLNISSGQSPLADTVELKNFKEAAEMIDQGLDVNANQPDGMTALHWAVYHDQRSLTQKLIRSKAEVNRKTRYGVAPLSLACLNGNEELIADLLEAGARVDESLPGGESPLMTAARTGKLKAVQRLLESGARVDDQEQHGQSALIWAAAEGHAKVVMELIRYGADFRSPLASGLTPLLLAARNGHSNVVHVLLEKGADLNETVQAKSRPHKGAPNGYSAILLAVENGHFSLALELVEAGADPNDQRGGFAPLHVLSWVRKPNRGDGPDGDPPPHVRDKLTSLQFAKRLVQAGADVNLSLDRGGSVYGIGRKGATPFLLASSTADLDYLKLLIELGADPKRYNEQGVTPLMAVAGVGTKAPTEEAGTEAEVLATLDFLNQFEIDINAIDNRGNTAMHGAAYKNLPATVHWLADHGATINDWLKTNKEGWTPIQIAEGFRPGNFKPSPTTVAAFHEVLKQAGHKIPPLTSRKVLEDRKGYPPNGP